jgi:hypothetical protein
MMMDIILLVVKLLVMFLALACILFVWGMCKAASRRDRMEELQDANCRQCIFDVPDEDDPSWKECGTTGHIPDEIFDKYDDDELPQHCGQFRRK